MKSVLKILGVAVAALLCAVGVGYWWASMQAASVTAQTFDAHAVDFPIPYPDVDGSVSLEASIARGKHLVEARYVCVECHGVDFGGGTMVDDPLVGTFLGPNLTAGKGSKVSNYQVADWDRTVRHGILPNGQPTPMPAEDFRSMSDQELADIIAYIRSLPPVDAEVPPYSLGPLGKVLMATGQFVLAANGGQDHHAPHVPYPPATEPNATFGKHLASVCTGCHGSDLAGGPIPGGPPDWPPAANLTPHADGLQGWTYAQFVVALREGRRPNGEAIKDPMTRMVPYARAMTDVELNALWSYLGGINPLQDRR